MLYRPPVSRPFLSLEIVIRRLTAGLRLSRRQRRTHLDLVALSPHLSRDLGLHDADLTTAVGRQ
jgi:hypothetical protein